jgi:UDPglucose 6-dehydrogenase
MNEPKWIFDGRGIIDVEEMEKLGGVRVDGIGKWRPEDGQKRCW